MSQKNGNEAAEGSRQKKKNGKKKKKQKKGGDKKGAVKKPSNQSVQSFDLHRKNRSFVFFVFFVFSSPFYSHSMVAGGLELMSYVTLLIPRTSLMILFEILPNTS